MNLNELIDTLTELRMELAAKRDCDEDEAGRAEVKMAYQPNYPLSADVGSACALSYQGMPGGYVVYVAEGGNSEYAPKGAWGEGVDESNEDEEV